MESVYNVYGNIGSTTGFNANNTTSNSECKTPNIEFNQNYHTQSALNSGFNLEMPNGHPKTLYIGNLHENINDEFLSSLFSQLGTIIKTKIFYESNFGRYGFIEFEEHSVALQALETMNKRLLLNKELKISWVIKTPTQTNLTNNTKNFYIFIGDLSPEVDEQMLKQAFFVFGIVTDVKIIRDMSTMKTKGYGFIAFLKYEEADKAIQQMNNTWLGRRKIRTNWAVRKNQVSSPSSSASFFKDYVGRNDIRDYFSSNFYQEQQQQQQSVFNLSYFQSSAQQQLTRTQLSPQLSQLFENNLQTDNLNNWPQFQTQQQLIQLQPQSDSPPLLNQPYLQYYQQYFNNYPHLQQEWQMYFSS